MKNAARMDMLDKVMFGEEGGDRRGVEGRGGEVERRGRDGRLG